MSAVSPDCETTRTAASSHGFFGAVAVLAGVLYVDGDAAEVFDDELGEQAGVAAGAAGSNDELAVDAGQPGESGGAGVCAEAVAVGVVVYRGGESRWLFVDFPQHPVGVGGGIVWGRHVRSHPIESERLVLICSE